MTIDEMQQAVAAAMTKMDEAAGTLNEVAEAATANADEIAGTVGDDTKLSGGFRLVSATAIEGVEMVNAAKGKMEEVGTIAQGCVNL